jgi:hypothetical protein
MWSVISIKNWRIDLPFSDSTITDTLQPLNNHDITIYIPVWGAMLVARQIKKAAPNKARQPSVAMVVFVDHGFAPDGCALAFGGYVFTMDTEISRH